MKRTIGFVALSVLWAAVSFGQALPRGMEKVTSVEGITEYKLANGLRVLVFPDPSKSTITVNMTYLVGSRQEGSGERGMAHLLEHMVFKGSTRHPNIPQELTEHGSRPNGTTSYDRTNYFETFQATDENLKWALDLEADRMVNSFIRKADLDSEFTVVRNEFEAGENNPISVLLHASLVRGVPVAPVRARGHREPGRHRARADRQAAGVLQEVLPARQRRPDRVGKDRRGEAAAADQRLVQSDPGAGPHAGDDLHGRAGAGRGTAGDAPAGGRHPGGAGGVPRPCRIRSGLRGDQRADGCCSADNPSGRLYKALVDGKKAAAVHRHRAAAERSGRRGIRGDREQAGPGGSGPHDPAGDHRQPGEGAAEQGRSRPRADAPARERRSAAQEFRADRTDDERMGQQGRLAPAVPEPGSAPQGHAGGRAARGQRVSEELEHDGGGIHSRPQAGPRGDSSQGRCRRHAEGLQGRCGDGGGRSVRSVSGEHRVARQAQPRSRRA